MRQEIRASLTVTFDAPAEFTNASLMDAVERWARGEETDLVFMLAHVDKVAEEAEIYGTNED